MLHMLNVVCVPTASASNEYVLMLQPDIPSQANVSVEQAIEAWPLLMSTGLRLGSPAVADPPNGSDHDWLGRFMSLAAAQGFQIDFMCVHYYSRLDTFDISTNVNALYNLLHKIHNKWQRPIWLTEFAMINWWGGSIGKYASPQEQAEFVQASADMIDTLPFVERYAWFALHKDHPEATNGLYDEHGTLTDVGQTFQQLKWVLADHQNEKRLVKNSTNKGRKRYRIACILADIGYYWQWHPIFLEY